MRNMLFYIVGCIFFLLGCTKSDDESYKFVLNQMEKIEALWTKDIHKAYQEIDSLVNSNPTSFFQNIEMCIRYVKFIDRMRIDSIPLDKRTYYVNRCFMSLIHPLYESAKLNSQNEAFRFIADADYFYKLSQEYPMVCQSPITNNRQQ